MSIFTKKPITILKKYKIAMDNFGLFMRQPRCVEDIVTKFLLSMIVADEDDRVNGDVVSFFDFYVSVERGRT